MTQEVLVQGPSLTMNKKNVSGSSLHNSLPSHNKTVQPKTGLATFFGIGTEEIRKSIEALDRMLDQYDGGGGAQSDGGVDKKFAPKKVDPAAHLLASCMKSAGSHKLRKSTPSTGHEDDLPPPPPELLTIKRNVSLTETSSMESLKTDQAKCKAAPMKPKRDPDTKLSTSSNDSNVSFYQISRDEIHYDASMPFHNYNEKRHPESGYITPDQETIDSVFLVCHDRMSGLRVSSHQLNPGPVQQQQQQQPAAFRLSGDASIAQQVYLDRPTLDNSSFNNFPLLPPAEFGDGMASSMQPPSRGQLEDFSQKLPFGNPVVALSGQTRSSQAMTTNEGRIDSYPGYPTDRNPRDEYRRSSGQVVSDYQIPRRDIPPFREANHVESIHSDVMMQPSIISTSISPYLACVVPPPPPMPADFTLCSKNTDLLLDSINIVPPPLPLDLSPNEMHILPPAPLDFALPLAVDIGAESLPDQLPSPMKLPPPPTMPKQPKRGSPQSSLDVADDSASPNALPFKVNLKPVAAKTKTQPKPEPPVPEKTSDSHIYANLHTSHSTNFPAAPPPVFDAPSDFLPPPPPPPCPPPMNLNLSFPPPPPDPPDFFKFSSSVNNGSFPRPMLDMNSSSSKSSSLTQLSTSGNFPRLNGDSLALSLQSVQLRNIDNQEKQTSRSSPPDAHAALINQIQTGIQLKQSVHGAKIRGQSQEDQSKPDSIKSTGEKSEFMFEEAGHNSGSGTCSSPPAFSDFNSANFSAEMPLNRENSGSSQSSCPDQPVDITQLPGYQEIPSSCPAWKKALIEKKNKQLEEDAMKDFLARKQEEERWKDIPEWKRNLIIEKEKKKQDDLAPYQAERKRQEGESEWLQSLPEWKRTLIIKKRGDLP